MAKRESSDYERFDDNLPIEDQQIINMSVKELNALLKSMQPAEAAVIKRRRRILKNKGYAANSRNRQTSLVGTLSSERDQLLRQIDQLKHENDNLSQELRGWKQRFTDLQLLTSSLGKGSVNERTKNESANGHESSS